MYFRAGRYIEERSGIKWKGKNINRNVECYDFFFMLNKLFYQGGGGISRINTPISEQ